MSAAGFLQYLGTLPRFDPELGTDDLQGDRAAGLKDADRARKLVKDKLSPHELQQLYAHADWINCKSPVGPVLRAGRRARQARPRRSVC